MMAAIQPLMLRPRPSDALKPRLPTLRHAWSFSRCSGSSCFAGLLVAACIPVISGESSAMPATTVESQDTAAAELGALHDAGGGAAVELETGVARLVAQEDREATPITRPHTDDARTPAAATPPSARPHTSPLGDAADSHFSSLSGDEKAERLIQAAEEGSLQELKALLAAGADLGARGFIRRTALHHAAEEGHVEAARCLLQAGAEVDARDFLEWTPLHLAAGKGHAAVVRLLLASSADPNSKNKWEWTPLHMAAYYGHAEAATVLLEAGADRGATNGDRRTPLDLARRKHYQQVKQLLERH